MSTLGELQTRFKDSLLGADDRALLELVDGDGLDPRARLAIYRHHVRTTLTGALEAAYPVVCRLVDRRFFAYAADAFISRHPPGGPCLGEFGGAFADFLAGFPACEGLPYLPDVARLEWAIHRATQQSPAAPLERTRLRSVDPSDMERLRFIPDPTVTLLASPWPVDRIWKAHQDGDTLPELAGGSVWLQIHARGVDVTLQGLEPATYAFRDALMRGLTLEAAAGLAFEFHPSFDLARELHDMLQSCIFNDFTITTREGT